MSHSSTESPNEHAGTAGLTETERHRLLVAERRRAVLDVLAEWTPPVELDDLVEAIADCEDDAALPRSELERRVAISLHHNHLPMMTDVGVVRYDPASNRIESTPSTVDRTSP